MPTFSSSLIIRAPIVGYSLSSPFPGEWEKKKITHVYTHTFNSNLIYITLHLTRQEFTTEFLGGDRKTDAEKCILLHSDQLKYAHAHVTNVTLSFTVSALKAHDP